MGWTMIHLMVLGFFAVALGDTPSQLTPARTLGASDDCVLKVQGGVANLLQAGQSIWASTLDCKAPASRADAATCAADIGLVISAVADVARYAIGIVGGCGGHDLPHAKCSQNFLEMASAISNLASTAGNFGLGCFDRKDFPPALPVLNPHLALCVVDVNGAMHSLTKVILSLTHIGAKCKASPLQCKVLVANNIADLADVAQFVLLALDNCQSHNTVDTVCGAQVASLISSLTRIVVTASRVEEVCKGAPAKARLISTASGSSETVETLLKQGYSQADAEATLIEHMQRNLTFIQQKFSSIPIDSSQATPVSGILGATWSAVLLGFIPLASFCGFVAGRRVRGPWMKVEGGDGDSRSKPSTDHREILIAE